MNWETVKIESKTIGRAAAFASVGRGQIVFNTTATKQIPNIEKVEFVTILTGTEDGSTFIGFSFKERMEEDCLKVKLRKDKQGAIVSVTVSNKTLMESLFGKIGSKQGTTQYPVTFDEGPNGEKLLVIKLK